MGSRPESRSRKRARTNQSPVNFIFHLLQKYSENRLKDAFVNEPIKSGSKKSTALRETCEKKLERKVLKTKKRLLKVSQSKNEQMRSITQTGIEAKKLQNRLRELESEREIEVERKRREEEEARNSSAMHENSREEQLRRLEGSIRVFGEGLLGANYNRETVYQMAHSLVGEEIAREFVIRVEEGIRRQAGRERMVEERNQDQ